MNSIQSSRWTLKTLDELAHVGAGNPAPQDKKLFEGGKYPFIRTSDVGQVRFGEISTAADLLNEHGVSRLRLVPKGTVLMPKSGASTFLNHRVLITADAFVSSHLATITPKDDIIDPRYLLYALSQVAAQDLLPENSYPSLNLNLIKTIKIPLPPLEEQQRIVAVLDEAFEGLARARAHAEVSLEDSHEIATRALDVLIADLIERNGRIPVSEIATVKGGKRLPKGEKTSTVETPFPYITVRDFTEDGTVSNEKLGFISEEIQKGIARYTISSQDVYVSIAGTIGKSGIVPDELDGANLTENAAKLVLEDGWSNEYVYWCTRSSDFGAQTAEQTRVAAQPKLALQRLGAITVPKADEAEQVELCEKMASLRSTRSDLVVAYGQKLQDLDDLRQSLLQKAFAGELT